MTNIKRYRGVLFTISIFFVSCIGVGPRSFHAPLLNEKGDLHAGAYINPLNGVEVQADYAWAEHFYSPVDFSFTYTGPDPNSVRSNFYSLGIGYYTKMKKNGRFNLYFTPMFGIYGNAGASSKNKFFSQSFGADVGHRFKHFETAFSLKLETFQAFDSDLNFKDGSTNIEPGLTMRFGGERFKYHMQFGLSYPFANNGDFLFYTFSMGLTYRLNVFSGITKK